MHRGVGVGIGAAAVGAAVIAPRYYNSAVCGYCPICPATKTCAICLALPVTMIGTRPQQRGPALVLVTSDQVQYHDCGREQPDTAQDIAMN